MKCGSQRDAKNTDFCIARSPLNCLIIILGSALAVSYRGGLKLRNSFYMHFSGCGIFESSLGFKTLLNTCKIHGVVHRVSITLSVIRELKRRSPFTPSYVLNVYLASLLTFSMCLLSHVLSILCPRLDPQLFVSYYFC